MSDAPATADNPEQGTDEDGYKLSLDVSIDDVGPCKKHVKVTVPRKDIEHFYDRSIDKFQDEASVPGFRVGHVPAKLIEKRFRKELSDQVKQEVLMESLEQISADHDLQAIDQPEMDVAGIELPEEGDFVYEFDVEVRPEFELPKYDGLKLERPVRTITEEHVTKSRERFLSQYGSLADRDGAAEAGDLVVVNLRATHAGQELREIEHVYLRLKPTLRLIDAELEGFDKLLVGKSAGETVSTTVTISTESSNVEMRGEAVELTFEIKSVKRIALPELTSEFLSKIGLEDEQDFDEAIRDSLERQVTYQQRQSTRRQVLEKITASANWDLPENLVLKQVENAMRREILEMQQAGFTTSQIRARENEMQQRALSETRQALKEHFVLDKIATQEAIEVSPSDIEAEIRMMAMSRGENPRRVRARLVKSGMIENLEAQIRERKAVDVIIEKAEFKDVEQAADDSNDNIEAIRYALCQTVTSVSAADEDDEAHDHDHDHDHDGHDHDHG